MAVGAFRSVVLDVNDMKEGERFWCAVLGLEAQWPSEGLQFCRLGAKGPGSVLLQLVPEEKTVLKNRAHIDITVRNVEHAVDHVVQLGGSVLKEPEPFPETEPLAKWAVMADPFGNEFCLIQDLQATL